MFSKRIISIRGKDWEDVLPLSFLPFFPVPGRAAHDHRMP